MEAQSPTLNRLSEMNGNQNSLRSTNYSRSMGQTKRETSMEAEAKGSKHMKGKVLDLIVWFLVIFVISWLALYSLKPSIIMKRNGREVDTGKILLGSFICSLLVVIIIWAIKAFTSKPRM